MIGDCGTRSAGAEMLTVIGVGSYFFTSGAIFAALPSSRIVSLSAPNSVRATGFALSTVTASMCERRSSTSPRFSSKSSISARIAAI